MSGAHEMCVCLVVGQGFEMRFKPRDIFNALWGLKQKKNMNIISMDVHMWEEREASKESEHRCIFRFQIFHFLVFL